MRATLVAVVLVVAACNGDADDSTAPSSSTTIAVERGTATAVADLVASGGAARHVIAAELPAAEGTVLVAFDLLPFDVDCLVALQLEVDVLSGDGELAVYPSIESGLPRHVEGTSLGNTLLRSNRPRASATPAEGSYRWDVADHYRDDPNVGDHVTSIESFALAIRPLTLIDATDAVFASTESGHGPRLRWTRRAVCPGSSGG